MKNVKILDIFLILFLPLIFVLFGFIPFLYRFYKEFNLAHPFIMSFIKFAILATYGEIAAFRINNKSYPTKNFGILPKMIVWGLLGIIIKVAFIIFGKGAIALLSTIFKNFNVNILSQKDFSILKLFASFTISLTMNLIFAPVMMLTHKITDLYIHKAEGTFSGILKTRFDLKLFIYLLASFLPFLIKSVNKIKGREYRNLAWTVRLLLLHRLFLASKM